MKCPACNKFDWVKDSKKHGNPSRYFVICPNDGTRAQCSKLTGSVFMTHQPSKYIATLIDLEQKHKVWLKGRGQSATIRQLVDEAMEKDK